MQKSCSRQVGPVHVGDIAAQHQCGLVLSGEPVSQRRLSDAQLNRVRARLHRGGHGLRQILDSGQKLRIVEDPVIDRQIEASAVRRKQAVQARVGKHSTSFRK